MTPCSVQDQGTAPNRQRLFLHAPTALHAFCAWLCVHALQDRVVQQWKEEHGKEPSLADNKRVAALVQAQLQQHTELMVHMSAAQDELSAALVQAHRDSAADAAAAEAQAEQQWKAAGEGWCCVDAERYDVCVCVCVRAV